MGFFVLLITAFFLIGYLVLQYDKSSKGYIESMFLHHVNGIPNVGNDVQIMFYLYPDKVTVNDQQTISIDRINSTKIFSSQQLTEENKSVIGRAVAGGMIAGGLGALIGGMTGTGTQKVSKLLYFFSIDFRDVNGNNSTTLFVLKSIAMIDKLSKISNIINEKIGCENRFDFLNDQNKNYEI